MSVLSVKLRPERQRSSYRDGKTTHTLIYLVECADIADGTGVALTADDGVTRIPKKGDYYRGVPFSGKDADRVPKSIKHFEVTCEFSGPGDGDEDDINPMDRPPEVTFGSDSTTEPYFLDKTTPDPKPVTNSATEAPDQFFERERGDLTFQFVRNVEYWDARAMASYGNTINQDGLYIDNTWYDEKTLKMSPPTASRQVETIRQNGEPVEVVYYRATFALKFREEGWSDRLADYGYNELITTTKKVNNKDVIEKKLQPIYDKAVGTLRKPWPLDGLGRKKPNPGDTPAELEFKPYTVRSWAALYF